MTAKEKMQIILIDTQILIWAVEKKCYSGHEELMKKAQLFLDDCYEKNHQIMISTVTLAEFLAKIPKEEQNQYLKIFSESFIIVPFDFNCSIKSSEIFQNDFNILKKSYKEKDLSRQHSRITLKDDIKIIASAIVYNPSVVISEDAEFKKITKQYINVSQLPAPPTVQPSLGL